MPVLSNAQLPGSPLNGSQQSFGAQLGQSISNGLMGAVGLAPNGRSTRENTAGMFRYSSRTVGPAPRFVFPSFPSADADWRVRVSLAPNSKYFYNDPQGNALLSPLIESGGGSDSPIGAALGQLTGVSKGTKRIGVVFPYTPTVTIQHTASYTPQKLTHSNYAQYFYDNSEVSAITLNTDFTVQNINEGQYLLAAIYFFRSCTKMFFGAGPAAGNPPPIVYLNGYGQYYLPNVPCVVTSFSHTMPADVDYMDIPEPGVALQRPVNNPGVNPLLNPRLNSTRMPTTSQMNLTLQPVYSRLAQSQGFSLEDFARGALINPVGAGKPASAFGATQPTKNVNNIKNGGFL
jgi:hypothetical protein